MPEPLAAEALQSTKSPTCGSLSLFDFEPGQYECSMGIFPVAGPNARQRLLTQPLNSAAVGDVRHQPRVSFDPPGCGSGMRVPALPGRGWQTPQLFRTRKDTERSCAFCVPSSFSCLSKFSVIQFSQVIRPKETLRGTNGYSSPFVHIQHTKKTRLTT